MENSKFIISALVILLIAAVIFNSGITGEFTAIRLPWIKPTTVSKTAITPIEYDGQFKVGVVLTPQQCQDGCITPPIMSLLEDKKKCVRLEGGGLCLDGDLHSDFCDKDGKAIMRYICVNDKCVAAQKEACPEGTQCITINLGGINIAMCARIKR